MTETLNLSPADLQRLADALWLKLWWSEEDKALSQRLNAAGYSPHAPRAD
jgi:hypothetical protein